MNTICYIDRITGRGEEEKIYGAKALQLIYGKDSLSSLLGPILLHSIVKYSFFSSLYGKWQSLSFTKKKSLVF